MSVWGVEGGGYGKGVGKRIHTASAHSQTHTLSRELARFGGGKAAAAVVAASPNARNYWPDVHAMYNIHIYMYTLWQSPLIAVPESSVKAHKA